MLQFRQVRQQDEPILFSVRLLKMIERDMQVFVRK